MNKGIIAGISGVVGAGLGSLGTFFIMKRKYKDVPDMEEVEKYINDEVSKAIKMVNEKVENKAENPPDIMPKPIYGPKVEKVTEDSVEDGSHIDYHNAFKQAPTEKHNIFDDAGKNPPEVEEDEEPVSKPTKSTIITQEEAFKLEETNGWVMIDLTYYKGDHILTEGENDDESIINIKETGIEEEMFNTSLDGIYFKNEENKIVYYVIIIPESYEETH